MRIIVWFLFLATTCLGQEPWHHLEQDEEWIVSEVDPSTPARDIYNPPGVMSMFEAEMHFRRQVDHVHNEARRQAHTFANPHLESWSMIEEEAIMNREAKVSFLQSKERNFARTSMKHKYKHKHADSVLQPSEDAEELANSTVQEKTVVQQLHKVFLGDNNTKAYLSKQKETFLKSLKNPTVSGYLCTQLDVSLFALTGVPITIHLGFNGQVAYNPTDRCYGLNFQANVGVSISVPFLDKFFALGISASSTVTLNEVTPGATDGADSSYQLDLNLDETKCNSNSLWDVVKTYLLSWQNVAQRSSKLRAQMEKIHEHAMKSDAIVGFQDYFNVLGLHALEDAIDQDREENRLIAQGEGNKQQEETGLKLLEKERPEEIMILAQLRDFPTKVKDPSTAGFTFAHTFNPVVVMVNSLTEERTETELNLNAGEDSHFRTPLPLGITQDDTVFTFEVWEANQDGVLTLQVGTGQINAQDLIAPVQEGETVKVAIRNEEYPSRKTPTALKELDSHILLRAVFPSKVDHSFPLELSRVMKSLVTPVRMIVGPMYSKWVKYAKHVGTFLENPDWILTPNSYKDSLGISLHRKQRLSSDDSIKTKKKDDRVLNFIEARTKSKHRGEPGFHMEWARSLANLFSRFVRGINAITSIYTVNDPYYNGDCSSLGASHFNFFETKSNAYPKHRSHLFQQESHLVKDTEKENPFLNYDWISLKPFEQHTNNAKWAASTSSSSESYAEWIDLDPWAETDPIQETASAESFGALLCETLHAAVPLSRKRKTSFHTKSSVNTHYLFNVPKTCVAKSPSGNQVVRSDCERFFVGRMFVKLFPSAVTLFDETRLSFDNLLEEMEDIWLSDKTNKESTVEKMKKKEDEMLELFKLFLGNFNKNTDLMRNVVDDLGQALGYDLDSAKKGLISRDEQRKYTLATAVSPFLPPMPPKLKQNRLVISGLPAAVSTFDPSNIERRQSIVLGKLKQIMHSTIYLPPIEHSTTFEIVAETAAPGYCTPSTAALQGSLSRQVNSKSWSDEQTWFKCYSGRVHPALFSIRTQMCWAKEKRSKSSGAVTLGTKNINPDEGLEADQSTFQIFLEQYIFKLNPLAGEFEAMNLLSPSNLLYLGSTIALGKKHGHQSSLSTILFDALLSCGGVFSLARKALIDHPGFFARQLASYSGSEVSEIDSYDETERRISATRYVGDRMGMVATTIKIIEAAVLAAAESSSLASAVQSAIGETSVTPIEIACEVVLGMQVSLESTIEEDANGKPFKKWKRLAEMHLMNWNRFAASIEVPGIIKVAPVIGLNLDVNMEDLLINYLDHHAEMQTQQRRAKCMECIDQDMAFCNREAAPRYLPRVMDICHDNTQREGERCEDHDGVWANDEISCASIQALNLNEQRPTGDIGPKSTLWPHYDA